MEGETQLSQAVLFITTCAPLHSHTRDTHKVGEEGAERIRFGMLIEGKPFSSSCQNWGRASSTLTILSHLPGKTACWLCNIKQLTGEG